MVLEVAQIEVKSGSEAIFEKQVARAKPLFLDAPGCHGMTLHRSIENPSCYRLEVQWETVEHHTVQFRSSPAFAQWRLLVGEYFASAPTVEHTQEVRL